MAEINSSLERLNLSLITAYSILKDNVHLDYDNFSTMIEQARKAKKEVIQSLNLAIEYKTLRGVESSNALIDALIDELMSLCVNLGKLIRLESSES